MSFLLKVCFTVIRCGAINSWHQYFVKYLLLICKWNKLPIE